MRQIKPYLLWIGHAGDARDTRAVVSSGITAIINLALNEPPVPVTRDLIYCRIPLIDGAENPSWLLRSAVEFTASLIRAGTPTLVSCSGGLSRSPAVVAGALSRISGESLQQALSLVAQYGQIDVTPGLWKDLVNAIPPPGSSPGACRRDA